MRAAEAALLGLAVSAAIAARCYGVACCVVLASVAFFLMSRASSGVAGNEHLDPSHPSYDKKMRELWGGPAPKHFPLCWETWPTTYQGQGKIALVTGGAGGVGFYVAKLLARYARQVPTCDPRPRVIRFAC